MASILLSGPAGGAKSQVAIELIKNATGPTIAADFQSIVVALLQLQRGPGWSLSGQAGMDTSFDRICTSGCGRGCNQ